MLLMNPEKGELSSIYSSINLAQLSLLLRLKSLDIFFGRKDVSLIALRMLLHLKTFVSI